MNNMMQRTGVLLLILFGFIPPFLPRIEGMCSPYKNFDMQLSLLCTYCYNTYFPLECRLWVNCQKIIWFCRVLRMCVLNRSKPTYTDVLSKLLQICYGWIYTVLQSTVFGFGGCVDQNALIGRWNIYILD